MKSTPGRPRGVCAWSRRERLGAACAGAVLVAAGCGGDGTGSGSSAACTPGDQDGITGGTDVIELAVSDTGFGVGAPDSGSTEPNITVQNNARVTLTLTNIGTKAHDFVVRCLPTPNDKGCPTQSCFPPGASLPAVAPGESATTTFTTPAAEGAYTFTSDEPGDTRTAPDGGLTGLVGELNLM